MRHTLKIDPENKTIPCTQCDLSASDGMTFRKNKRGHRNLQCNSCIKKAYVAAGRADKARRAHFHDMQAKYIEKNCKVSRPKKCDAPEGMGGAWLCYKVYLGSINGPTMVYCPEKGLKASLAATSLRMKEGIDRDKGCSTFFLNATTVKISSPLGNRLSDQGLGLR